MDVLANTHSATSIFTLTPSAFTMDGVTPYVPRC